MVRKLALLVIILALVGGAAFWFLSAPARVDPAKLAAAAPGDPQRGSLVFWQGGCSSCHAAPGAKGDARLVLAGGLNLVTPFGTFVAPNISPSTQGIGDWSFADLANAMMEGVSPDGRHFYPAFPYTSYARMQVQDIADLYAFMKTLPPSGNVAGPHKLNFPFTIRRGIGLWKRLYLSPQPVLAIANATDAVKRGQYLVEGPGHCGECHTPRDALGGLDKTRWLAGARSPEGKGVVPNITGGEGGIDSWSEKDISYALESGFTPDFDSLGGSMADVALNTAHLDPADRDAIAAYLKAVPAHPNGYPATAK
ncbi:cytochrome c [Phyllobacterium endophyticum]|uniref:Cytochrome C n=1 Tax=Phyllobacterium endophyticum TaxID=1149773 RepID=A0A2P7B208_9HYPH|nr:cytochrome c [Phyllobacterium endophyticum]MBB3238067.1 mono/diheme cytochrome c family protein [Phyllobacterium endophyticum]PSH60480.1 cytochrome C [Phyllobacterium endophyticum]TYR42656.1 c-type cytochrome [Phyllobacterium endophyticum]